MIRPAKIFEAAVKHQAEQNKGGFSADDVAPNAEVNSAETYDIVNPSDAPIRADSAGAADDAKNENSAAEGAEASAEVSAGKKKLKFKVPSVRPKIGTVL